VNRIGGCAAKVPKQGAAPPTGAEGVLLFNKMDVFTYRLPAFQAFSAAHSLSREPHHLAILSVTRTVHTDSNGTGHLTAQKEALWFRYRLVCLSVHMITSNVMLRSI
jgi:hypothetical protein